MRDFGIPTTEIGVAKKYRKGLFVRFFKSILCAEIVLSTSPHNVQLSFTSLTPTAGKMYFIFQ
jgi:hypothetical protein